jgi:hypothetical protein
MQPILLAKSPECFHVAQTVHLDPPKLSVVQRFRQVRDRCYDAFLDKVRAILD